METPNINDFLEYLYQKNQKIKVSRNKHNFTVIYDKYNWFWKSFNDEKWEKSTIDTFDRFIDIDTIYVDIGAWIGPTVLYASKISKRVYAFEPSLAFGTLKNNVELNMGKNNPVEIRLFNCAVGLEDGKISLGSDESGNSKDSIIDKRNTYDVDQVNFISFLEGENLLDEKLFIKIDIEGAEYLILEGLLKSLSGLNIKLHVSTHPRMLYRSLRENQGFFVSIFKTLYFHYKILRFPKGFIYSENLMEIKHRFIWTLKSINQYQTFIYSSDRVLK